MRINQHQWLAEVQHPLHKLGFWFAMAYVFIMFSDIHELIAMVLGAKPYILIIVTVPMMLLVWGSGGIRRTLRWPVARYWMGFALWMLISVPFSSWRGGSVSVAVLWIRAELPILFAIAGCVITLWEFNRLMVVLAAAAVVNVFAGRLFASQISGRLGLAGTTIANANDYAAHLTMVLPLLAMIIVDPRRWKPARAFALALMLYGIYLILSTGSRGGLLALGIAVLFCLWKLRPRQKASVALAVAISVCGVIAVMPEQALQRFTTILNSGNKLAVDRNIAGAQESAEVRSYLLRQSVLITLKRPLFGVGMGQFQSYEGRTSSQDGQPGYWYETHNSFTQVSSEMGIPAMAFYIAAIIATYRMLNRAYKVAQQHSSTPGIQRMRITAFCLLLSLVGFCAASFFLSLAYRFYLPALAGMAIACTRAVKQTVEPATVVPTAAPSPDVVYALGQ